MASPYKIYTYSIHTLKGLLAEKSGALPSIVDQKLQTLYFENYFDDLGASSIIVENDYVDRDYMEDYAGFYARCFGKYNSSCTRLHFFDIAFTSKQFAYTLLGRGKKLTRGKLQKSYLGFIVVKKLPEKFIGRTCLRSYGSDNYRRVYPTLRRYPVSLFGIDLSVDKTLGFQEQDRGAAACATSALWTVFQGTGKLFQHNIPSQVEITRLATQLPEEDVPGFLPSRGLTGRQEIYTIRQLGLEADHTNAQNQFNMTGSVYSYLRAGIPLVLRVTLYDTSNKSNAKKLGGHAIAITGFSLGRNSTIPYGSPPFKLRATKIDKLYVHDDQVGPFARMNLDGIRVREKQNNQVYKWNSLSSSWIGANQKIGSIRAVPRFLLIPLYPKIRIRFQFIRDVIIQLDVFLWRLILGPRSGSSPPSPFEWDIFLTNVNDLKSDIRDESNINDGVKRKLLLKNLPRFIWRTKVRYQNKVLLELLFDATDIEGGKFFVHGIEYENSIFQLLRVGAQKTVGNPYYQSRKYWRILNWFATES